MGKLKAWAMEHGMDDANEQQFHAEMMAELEQQESDADWLAWLDRMDSCGAPRPLTVAGEMTWD